MLSVPRLSARVWKPRPRQMLCVIAVAINYKAICLENQWMQPSCKNFCNRGSSRLESKDKTIILIGSARYAESTLDPWCLCSWKVAILKKVHDHRRGLSHSPDDHWGSAFAGKDWHCGVYGQSEGWSDRNKTGSFGY